jgi:EAL domain-containing protein (putative c-di-GMP-specific phosphodiesterase class I)
LALLREFGCDQVQGYLISRPLPLAELVDYLTYGSSQQPALEIVS